MIQGVRIGTIGKRYLNLVRRGPDCLLFIVIIILTSLLVIFQVIDPNSEVRLAHQLFCWREREVELDEVLDLIQHFFRQYDDDGPLTVTACLQPSILEQPP
jgi:hypothetical protein